MFRYPAITGGESSVSYPLPYAWKTDSGARQKNLEELIDEMFYQ